MCSDAHSITLTIFCCTWSTLHICSGKTSVYMHYFIYKHPKAVKSINRYIAVHKTGMVLCNKQSLPRITKYWQDF